MQQPLFLNMLEKTKMRSNYGSKPNIELEELFQAYFDCRKNKRNTTNSLAFEIDYERELVELCDDINSGTYKPGRSIAFIVTKPIIREIFAADFRDRVVHHLVINKLNPLFEKKFIHDSYSCRIGKGTSMGIKRVDGFIRRCSKNYSSDCYILKLDITGFFMNINKDILFNRLKNFIEQKYLDQDQGLIIDLCKKIVYKDATENCKIKGLASDWNNLPQDKSLFHAKHNCGLPIGNLSSQVFANFYLDIFDHFIKNELKISFYGRYVDDFVIVHPSKEYLKELVVKIRAFLKNDLKLTLHPKKIYLQHYIKGVKFLGVIIKPYHMYPSSRLKGNLHAAILKQNSIVSTKKPTLDEKNMLICSMNSYLGLMKSYRSFRIGRRIIDKYLSPLWWNYVWLNTGLAKLVLCFSSKASKVYIGTKKR